MSDEEKVAKQIREFIYLDIDRVESFLAQLEEGLVSGKTRTEDSSTSRNVGGGSNILGVAKAEGSLAWESAQSNSESTVLHDFAYVQLETRLRTNNRLRVVGPSNSDPVNPADFILFQGDIVFDDYEYLAQMIGTFVDIEKHLGVLGKQEEQSGKKNRNRTNQGQSSGLSRKYTDSLETLVRTFYRDRMIVKSDTEFRGRAFRIQGAVQRQHLRDTPEELRFKFGDRPSGNWLMLGQVATIGSPQGTERKQLDNDSQMDLAISNLFVQLSEVERFFLGTAPLVSITPIAVYRLVG